MATDLKRFTISITPSMEAELDSAKRDRYYRGTQNAMIRDLINRGLASKLFKKWSFIMKIGCFEKNAGTKMYLHHFSELFWSSANFLIWSKA